MNEASIQQRIQLALSALGTRIFRNNTGVGWVGTVKSRTQTSITLLNPRPLHAGLTVGSSDLIGWTPITITPEMVGQTVAVFTGVEVKTPTGRATDEQRQFLKVLGESGGIAVLARSESDAVAGVLRFSKQ